MSINFPFIKQNTSRRHFRHQHRRLLPHTRADCCTLLLRVIQRKAHGVGLQHVRVGELGLPQHKVGVLVDVLLHADGVVAQLANVRVQPVQNSALLLNRVANVLKALEQLLAAGVALRGLACHVVRLECVREHLADFFNVALAFQARDRRHERALAFLERYFLDPDLARALVVEPEVRVGAPVLDRLRSLGRILVVLDIELRDLHFDLKQILPELAHGLQPVDAGIEAAVKRREARKGECVVHFSHRRNVQTV